MKSKHRTDENLSPEIYDAFDRLQTAFSDLWPLMGERIDQQCPKLSAALDKFVRAGGHFRFMYRFRPEVQLVLEAIAPDGEIREVYRLKGRDRVRPTEGTRDAQGARDAAQPLTAH